MEPRELEPFSLPREQSLLLENLRSNQNVAFEDLARRALAQPNIDVDFVYPHPLNKTLLEVACCEGRVEFVEHLLKLGANVNRLNDVHNRAPIHFAAEAGHADVLKVLLQEKRCNPDLEVGKQTALHIAVRSDSTDCVRALLDSGANPNITNSKGLTPIHIAGTNENREVVQLILKISQFPPNLDDFRDFRRRTTRQILQQKFPDLELPTAGESKIEMEEVRRSCFEGNESDFLENLRRIDDDLLTDVDELIKFAAKRNFPEAIGELLKKGRRDDCLLGVAEASKIAVELGHHRVLREILSIDSKLGTKLLLPACKELGVPCSPGEDHRDDRINCVRLILEQPDINVRCEDDKGNTPLHYAARAESVEAVGWLLRLGSYIGHRNVLGVPPLAHMSPGALSDFFDDCIRSENDRTDEYEIEFDYRSLMPHTASSRRCDEAHEESRTSKINENISVSSEMEALAYIAENRALKPLLKHPLLSSFLYLKWHRIRHVLYANFVFYVIFYILINFYILSTNHEIDSSSSSPPMTSNFQHLQGLGALAGIFLILLAVRETFQLVSSPGHYLSSFENMLELALIVLGAWVLVTPNPQVGAVVILLSAWELVILIGQYPRMSTGIEMFKTVTINFIRFLFLYAFLILAFALAFFTLFYNAKDNENFPDPGHSLFKTIIMLTGEFDANDIPFVSHPVLSRCIFILFVFLIAIVLFNLLNGLAVSDTADILNKSELVGLISRAKLVSYAERVAVGTGLMKFTGLCFSARTVRQSLFNPLGFLAMRILLFPEYLPQGKLGVQPYKSNKIHVYGRTRKTRSCADWSMDPLIVGRAREVLSRRGGMTENERIIAELGTVKNKLERLETVIDSMRSALENNNIRSNGED